MTGITAWLAAPAVAAVAAAAALRRTVRGTGPGASVRNGPWRTDVTTGSARARPARRAKVARQGLWALRSEEALYFEAACDSDGRPLDGGSVYRVEGGALAARWWSLTVYRDRHLVPNPDDRYSFSMTNVTRAEGGRWCVVLAAAARPGDWIPIGDGAGRLTVLLRFYHPEPDVLIDPGSAALPRILREGAA